MAVSVLPDVRDQFPILARPGLVYLDSAATAQTPTAVIEEMDRIYQWSNANIHRSVYALSQEATDAFEGARRTIAERLGAAYEEIVFTKNITEAINLVAYSWGRTNVGEGDRVLITQMEHHANIVPWQQLVRERGATLGYVDVRDDGSLDLDSLDRELSRGRVKLVGVVHVSNVLGTINPVAEILGRDGVCVRAGHHCAQPLMSCLGVPATSRASIGVHNTREEIDRLIDGLANVRRVFRLD